jgi:BirA family biotin operon repressor/biotin-[acetyl-CoA-carboxylase] ligase
MEQNELFSILDTVDSTNNYATGQVHAGLAKHGEAWFAMDQFAGKGQRGKSWKSTPGENLMMSIAINPDKVFSTKPFLFSVLVAAVCREVLTQFVDSELKIKWPNDIYWRDRKAGGILIENIFRGSGWGWAVVGIGININQTQFDDTVTNGTSLKLITGKDHDPILIAKKLQQALMERLDNIKHYEVWEFLEYYNEHLYKKGEVTGLKKGSAVFQTTILSVNEYGQLLTKDAIERTFEFGEVVWVR